MLKSVECVWTRIWIDLHGYINETKNQDISHGIEWKWVKDDNDKFIQCTLCARLFNIMRCADSQNPCKWCCLCVKCNAIEMCGERSENSMQGYVPTITPKWWTWDVYAHILLEANNRIVRCTFYMIKNKSKNSQAYGAMACNVSLLILLASPLVWAVRIIVGYTILLYARDVFIYIYM